MKKIISLVIVLAMIMAFASPAFATTKTNATLSSSSTSSSSAWRGMTISRDAWTTSGGSWQGGSASGLTLTVRPYSDDAYDYKLSIAYSYSKTKLNGGQTYDLLAYPIYVKYNSNTSGSTAALKATWYF